jgi:hypothetical protein
VLQAPFLGAFWQPIFEQLFHRLDGSNARPEAGMVFNSHGISIRVGVRRHALPRQQTSRNNTTAIPSPAVAVPATLQASLMARLDRLGRAKEVAQVGAAGRAPT